MSFFVYHVTKRTTTSHYAKWFTLYGFLQSVIFMIGISRELVNLFEAFGVLSGIKSSVLGMTLFAFGNSIGELITNYSLAKMGSRTMAMCACFGGPMFSNFKLM
jgi:sodium/potassium/calcium exchanger 6